VLGFRDGRHAQCGNNGLSLPLWKVLGGAFLDPLNRSSRKTQNPQLKTLSLKTNRKISRKIIFYNFIDIWTGCSHPIVLPENLKRARVLAQPAPPTRKM
jgi:hypothetical protein